MRASEHPEFGPYRIVRQIAAGGMAEIYLARHRGLEGIERTVVIKRLLERYAYDAEFVTMFLDEARLMAGLSHPNIAQVFDVGRHDTSSYYLVMEHVRGPTLRRLLQAARAAGEPGLPRREALGIALAVAEALHYVHERRDELGRPLGIVHRDLNPANVVVSYDGGVKLIDFGIAKAATKVYETRTGVIKGTYGYIAPEQLAGSGRVDRRADVFALGILLYEMCVGEHPYDVSDEANLVDRIVEMRYRRARDVRPDIPVDLDRLIASCLAPSPEGRPADVAAVIEALAQHLGEQKMVPTQHAIAALARRLVPDEEGPEPVARPRIVHLPRRRRFGEEPTGTVKIRRSSGEPVGPPTPAPSAWIDESDVWLVGTAEPSVRSADATAQGQEVHAGAVGVDEGSRALPGVPVDVNAEALSEHPPSGLGDHAPFEVPGTSALPTASEVRARTPEPSEVDVRTSAPSDVQGASGTSAPSEVRASASAPSEVREALLREGFAPHQGPIDSNERTTALAEMSLDVVSAEPEGEEPRTTPMPLRGRQPLEATVAPEIHSNAATEPPSRQRARSRRRVAALGALGLATAVLIALLAMRAEWNHEKAAAPIAPAFGTPAGERVPAALRLRVVSEPAGAQVHVDGRPVEGVTPLELRLPSGARRVWVRVSMPGYLEQEREVYAAAGETRFVLTRSHE